MNVINSRFVVTANMAMFALFVISAFFHPFSYVAFVLSVIAPIFALATPRFFSSNTLKWFVSIAFAILWCPITYFFMAYFNGWNGRVASELLNIALLGAILMIAMPIIFLSGGRTEK